MKTTLPTNSDERKRHPVADGPLSYFPAAIAGVALVCQLGDEKHNKNSGLPMHHARGKSGDHANCIVRHLMDVNDMQAYLDRGGDDCAITHLLHEANQLAWRALALAQELHETYGGAPLAPGARLPVEVPVGTVAPVLDYSHEMPAAFPQEQADAAADDIVGQIVSGLPPLHGPAGADWRAPMSPPAVDRLTYPPLVSSSGQTPSVRKTDDDVDAFYFNRDTRANSNASNRQYPTEAAARAAYWADKDAG